MRKRNNHHSKTRPTNEDFIVLCILRVIGSEKAMDTIVSRKDFKASKKEGPFNILNFSQRLNADVNGLTVCKSADKNSFNHLVLFISPKMQQFQLDRNWVT